MQNKPIALVTGANKGIGLQIAKDLATHGLLRTLPVLSMCTQSGAIRRARVAWSRWSMASTRSLSSHNVLRTKGKLQPEKKARHTRVWARQPDDRWVLISHQATEIAEARANDN